MSNSEEINETQGLDRRTFLKGAAIAAGTGIIAGCAPKVMDETTKAAEDAAASAQEAAPALTADTWYGSAPEIAESDISETRETEILICGSGHAGKMAALAAAELGAQVLVIEKNPTVGPTRDWVGAVGTKAQIEAGADIDRNEIVADMARYGSGHVNQKLIQVWADESGETVEWLAGILADYGFTHVSEYDVGDGMHGAYKCWPTHTKFLAPEGEEITYADCVVEKAEELGAEYLFKTPLVKLIRENGDSGRVTGVIAQNDDDSYIQINASKGVLLCTGGYADNDDLYSLLNPSAASVTTLKIVNPGNSGDGIKAGIWAGGVKDKQPAAMLFDRGITVPGGKAGTPFRNGGGFDFFNMGSQPFLKVNMDGKRYCCESTPYDFCLYPLQYEKNGVFCMIWDANYWQHMESFHTIGCSRMIPSESVPPTFEGMGKEMTDSFIEGFIEAGMIQKADSIEELAEKLILPGDAFKATIERYNQMAEAGVDEDFGKPAKDLLALTEAPFYGVTIGAWLLTTMDGLRINTDMQVMDADFNAIEGLYAAGDVAGGFFAHNYPELAVGIACGKSMTFARHAVRHILGEI